MANFSSAKAAHKAHFDYPFEIEPGKEWSPGQEKRLAALTGMIGSDFLGDVPLLNALDIGCNTGYFCSLLQEDYGIKAIGVDVSLAMVEKAKERNVVALPVPAEDVATIFAEGEFSFAILSEILEHVFDPIDVLSKAMTVSKYGVFGTVPHEHSEWGDPDKVRKHPHHCRRYTIETLAALLGLVSNNFVIQSIWREHYIFGAQKL